MANNARALKAFFCIPEVALFQILTGAFDNCVPNLEYIFRVSSELQTLMLSSGRSARRQ